ncbi:MAG: VWA domain-containing protein [Gammaproteobacteria bacterium]|nr:VWA domain-containing protein [Gammaproteobacteria bacterium]
MIHLLWPLALVLLPLPLLIIWLIPAGTRRSAALRVPFFEQISQLIPGAAASTRQTLWQRVLLGIIWICLLLAAARPQFIGEAIQLPATGRDLMLAVDISGSMGTDDMLLNGRPVTRLKVVKAVVGQFVERRKGDRLGLILFGTNAYLQAPLTFDRETVRTLLEETYKGIAGEKTAIGDAIGLAVKRLASRPENDRVLILLTDGVNNVGEVSPLQAARLAEKENIRIHTIGFGSDPLSAASGLIRRPLRVSVELDEASLTEIAESTGGTYHRARDGSELDAIYRLLDRIEPVAQENETYRPVKSLYFWPLGLALALSLLLALRDSAPFHFGWRWSKRIRPEAG